jgi:predicted RNA-binding protein YlxR (DUF448 family)
MVRVVAVPDGHLVLARSAPGRGAWICRDAGRNAPGATAHDDRGISIACLSEAMRRGALRRALRADLAPDAAERLVRELGSIGEGD